MPKITIEETVLLVLKELTRAQKKFKPFNSPHEGLGVVLEEYDEFKDEIKANNTKAACQEAAELAAVAMRFILDLHDNTILEDAQIKAATTGNREDLQEYLKLRREML